MDGVFQLHLGTGGPARSNFIASQLLESVVVPPSYLLHLFNSWAFDNLATQHRDYV